MDEITLIDVPAQTVLGIRKTGHYRMIAEFVPAIASYAEKNGIPLLGPPLFVMHETTLEKAKRAYERGTADVEVAIPVPGDTEPGPGMNVYTLPGGKMARTCHRGLYMECETTYHRLYTWLEERGLTITGPMREVYINDPNEVPPAEFLTEFMAPVE